MSNPKTQTAPESAKPPQAQPAGLKDYRNWVIERLYAGLTPGLTREQEAIAFNN